MKSKHILIVSLLLMLGLVITAIVFTEELTSFLYRPSWYGHILFAHIFSVSLFFANAVVGMLWEMKSLQSNQGKIILHTYETVSWLDARFSTPLIFLSIFTGIMLSVIIGNIWEIGWLSLAFFLFCFSGALWIISDIPTQYKIKRLMKEQDPESPSLSPELMAVLKMRLWISLAGVLPLIVVFILMVYKPEIKAPAQWF